MFLDEIESYYLATYFTTFKTINIPFIHGSTINTQQYRRQSMRIHQPGVQS